MIPLGRGEESSGLEIRGFVECEGGFKKNLRNWEPLFRDIYGGVLSLLMVNQLKTATTCRSFFTEAGSSLKKENTNLATQPITIHHSKYTKPVRSYHKNVLAFRALPVLHPNPVIRHEKLKYY